MAKKLTFTDAPPDEPPMTTPKKRPKPSPKTGKLPADGSATLEQVKETEEYQTALADIREAEREGLDVGMGYRVVLGVDVSLTGTGLAWLESPSGDRLTARIANPARAVADSSHRAVGEILKGAPVPLGVRLDRLCSDVTIAVADNWSPLPKLAVIERPFSNPKTPGTNELLGMAQGAVLIALTRLYIPTVFVPPKTRSKFATGNGNASKDEVLAAAVEQFGYSGTDGFTHHPVGENITKARWAEHYDHADALILAVIGGYLLGEGFEIPDLQLYDEQYEALEKLPDLSELLATAEEEPF